VGSNGAGKSTLLKIILGEAEADYGNIVCSNYVTLGYLPQEGITTRGRTVYEEAELAFSDILNLRENVDKLSEELYEMDPSSDEYYEAIDMIGAWEHKLEDMEAHRMKSRIETVLLGLGFTLADLTRDCGEFSGGWQMRIALAKLLLREPSLLLLDEPTNHLDLPSLRWLEQFLKRYEGALMIISHDRAFLDNLCNRTFELTMGRLEVYAGNYSFYEEEKVRRRELNLLAFKNQQKKIQQTEDFINRFRSKASKARQVQSRIKALDKVDRVTVEKEETRIHFRFPKPPVCGHNIVTLEGITKAYGDLTVFKNINIKLENKDRIAVVGVNGAGKSTLARVIAGIEEYQAGKREQGHKVLISYFAQQQAEALDPAKSVLEIAEEAADYELRVRARTVLGAFLFRGDDVFKKVKVLSGGEKCRLALACILLQKSNCMILDEPTNHLDMYSKKMLQEALCEYDGTLIIVSHDREFLTPIVDKVWDITENGINVHLGTISDYIQALEDKDLQILKEQRKAGNRSSVEDDDSVSQKEKRRLEVQKREEQKPLRDKLEATEKEINSLEAQKNDLELKLADPNFFKDNTEAPSLMKEHSVLQEKLEKLIKDWEKLTAAIEEV